MLTQANRQLGIALSSAGLMFTILGFFLFWNKTLLRIGNVLLVASFPYLVGPGRFAGYFLQPKKARATASFALGFLLVLAGRPVWGIILEIFGFLNIFGTYCLLL
jgi:hypothetical protein